MDDLAISAPRPRAPRRRYPGLAPLPGFDFDSLPDGAWLATIEVAGVLRRAKGTLEMWRQNPEHPLRWEYVDGKPLYKVRWLRDFIALRTRA